MENRLFSINRLGITLVQAYIKSNLFLECRYPELRKSD